MNSKNDYDFKNKKLLQMFDSTDLKEAVYNIYDSGMKDDTLALLYARRHIVHPHGILGGPGKSYDPSSLTFLGSWLKCKDNVTLLG